LQIEGPMPSAYLAQPVRTEAEIREKREALAVAVAWRKIIWRQAARDEDERIDRLTDVCTRLCDGDLDAGRQLATKAIWSAG
jgi:hypothetical protein